MKGSKGYVDLGTIFDEIFEAAQSFSDEIHRNINQYGPEFVRQSRFRTSPFAQKSYFDENTDYYPNYSYPPMNVYMLSDRSMIFEFALAGFDEKDINLSFQGDYMVFEAKLPLKDESDDPLDDRVTLDENIRYFKRRLKMKDIEKQKYYVPLDKYAQDQVKAVYKNGILKVAIPPKNEPDQNDGIKIEIIKEGN